MALWVWYRGGAFCGFQRQPDRPSIQGALEDALARAGMPAGVMPSGRTDRGVHARMQVVSVRLPADVDLESLPGRLAPHLPGDVGVAAARAPPDAFHAQWSAEAKQYRYRLQLGGRIAAPWTAFAFDPAEEPRLAGREVRPEALQACLARARGTRDFSAFHERSSPRKLRHLERASLEALGDGLHEVILEGSGFARYQVRYLVGSALLAAAGVLPMERFQAAFDTAETVPGLKAPAHGLVLWEVRYPPACDPFTPEERKGAEGVDRRPPFAQP